MSTVKDQRRGIEVESQPGNARSGISRTVETDALINATRNSFAHTPQFDTPRIDPKQLADLEILSKLVLDMLGHLPEEIEAALDPGIATHVKRLFNIGQTTPPQVAANITLFINRCNALFIFLKDTARYDNYDQRAIGPVVNGRTVEDGMKSRLLTNIAASAQRARGFAHDLRIPYSGPQLPVLIYSTGDTGNYNLSDFSRGIKRDISGLKGEASYYDLGGLILELAKKALP